MSGNFNIFCHSLPYLEAPLQQIFESKFKIKETSNLLQTVSNFAFYEFAKKKKNRPLIITWI